MLSKKSSQKPNYDGEFVAAIRANVSKVIDLLDKKDAGLSKRVNTFASRFDFVVESIEEKIRKDEVFRAVFAKDPGKQKIHENIAARFIEQMQGVVGFQQLGHDALVVFGGRVETRKAVLAAGAGATAKTIDFEWISNGRKIYASHKYTKQSGGAQDNQYKDLQLFIREANESNLKDTYFLAIADGDYYLTTDRGTGGTKMERLKDISNKRNVFALSIDELEDWIKTHCA